MSVSVDNPFKKGALSTALVLRRADKFVFLAAVFLLPFIALAQPKSEDLSHPKTLAELQSAIRQIVERDHLPGAGVALISNGEMLWCGGIGKANVSAKENVTCDTEFRVGSVSKTFIALALLKLEEEGKISLQARLHDIAPEVPMRNPWEASNPVRVVNILEHTAGFDDMSLAEIYNSHNAADIPLLQVLQKFSRAQNVRWPPGTRMAYSNPDYGVAGYVVEKIAGEPWPKFVREDILVPLGITCGDFVLTETNRALLAQGYHRNYVTASPYREIYLRPAGDMKASPGEMAKLVQFFLRRGIAGGKPLLKPETIARMELPQTSLSAWNGLRLGYGLANYTEVRGGVITYGHDGGIDGFVSSYRYMPEENWGYVLLLNSDPSYWALEEMNRLATNFLSKDFPHVQQPIISLPRSELQKFSGYYVPRAPRWQMLAFMEDLKGGIRVRVHEGHLIRSGLFGKPEVLLPVGKKLFRLDKDPEATTVFFPNAEGTMCYAAFGNDRMPYAERISPIWPYARLGLLALCVMLMASALLFAVVWILRWIFGRMKSVKHLSVRAVPLLAILTLATAVFGAVKAVDQWGKFGFWAMLFFAGTILFAVMSLAGLWLALRARKGEIHPGVRIHSLLVSAACCVVTLFLISWHLIGLRLWAA